VDRINYYYYYYYYNYVLVVHIDKKTLQNMFTMLDVVQFFAPVFKRSYIVHIHQSRWEAVPFDGGPGIEGVLEEIGFRLPYTQLPVMIMPAFVYNVYRHSFNKNK